MSEKTLCIIKPDAVENNFVDFDRDRLLFHMSSSEGSCICEGDINGDGYKDLYIGGSKGYS